MGPSFNVYGGRLLGREGSRHHSLVACVKGNEETDPKRETKRVFPAPKWEVSADGTQHKEISFLADLFLGFQAVLFRLYSNAH